MNEGRPGGRSPRVDLRRRLPNREADQLFKGHDRRPAAHTACAIELDSDGPVSDVWSLGRLSKVGADRR